jgi:hypothetical protein
MKRAFSNMPALGKALMDSNFTLSGLILPHQLDVGDQLHIFADQHTT